MGENLNPEVTFFFKKTVFPKSLPKHLIASAVTLELGASLGWNLSHTMLQQQACCFLSTIWLAHALLCTVYQGPLSLQAQHKVKVNQHIIVGTLLCWKQTSLPSVSATWYWLRHHKEEKSLMHPAYFAMQCIVITVEDVLELRLENEAPFWQHFAQECCNGFCRQKTYCPNHQNPHFLHFLGSAAKSRFRHILYCTLHFRPPANVNFVCVCVCVCVCMKVWVRDLQRLDREMKCPKGTLNRPHPLVQLASSVLRWTWVAKYVTVI